MFTLAHLSDIHLGPMPDVTLRQLFSKRITGYLNWKLNRKGSMQDGSLTKLTTHLMESKPNHLAISGDLVNLALPVELSRMRDWLEQLGPPEDISIVLGNHDAYVPHSLKSAVTAWEPYLQGDSGPIDPPFPYRRDRESVAVIGANSAQATLPFMATGYFRADQAKRLARHLDEAKQDGQFRVVMIHHPPYENGAPWSKRLIGTDLFCGVIKDHGAELVLHGHNHVNSLHWIDGPERPVAVVGVPAAGKSAPPLDADTYASPGGRYNIYSISGGAERWSCKMDEFGFANGENTVSHMGSADCMNP